MPVDGDESVQRRRKVTLPRRSLLGQGLGLAALMLPPGAVRAAEEATPRRRARAVIVLLLEGGLSHLESWDPKPEGPAEVRGSFGTIRTTNPDLVVCEHLPLLARQAHRYNVIRSVQNLGGVNHDHALHRLLTGYDHPTIKMPQDVLVNHYPSQGALVARDRGGATADGLPPFVAIPDRGLLGKSRHLLGAGYLGAIYEAFESGPLPGRHTDSYHPPVGLALPPQITPGRLTGRRRLLREIDSLRQALDTNQEDYTAHQQSAFTLLLGGAGRAAFDLNAETQATRERYGDSGMGQGMLLARRLAEAGVPYVLVNCGYGNNLWDTHADNFNRLRNELLPPLDRAASALLVDLDERGMLDETLVVMLTEFGRTPQINKDAGRDHWGTAYSVMLAGGGLTRGRVLGRTTHGGEEPDERPVPVNDVLATIYHQLGIDFRRTIPDAQARPVDILPPTAAIIPELFA